MSLAGLLKHNTFRKDELPLKYIEQYERLINLFHCNRLAACSRCYRAELPGGKTEGHLYRVHEFTKVEMFIVTTNDEQLSEEMHHDIVRLQTLMFEELGLHLRFICFIIFLVCE